MADGSMSGRSALGFLCLLVAMGLPSAAGEAAQAGARARHYRLAVLCNGGKSERSLLTDEAATKVREGTRAFLSGAARAVYRFPIGEARPERVHLAVFGASWAVESSPDGKRWETLLRDPRGSAQPQPFSEMSCGLSPSLKQAASEAGVVYVRIRPCSANGEGRALELLTLEVSAAARPPGFSSWAAPNPLRRVDPNMPLAAANGAGLLLGLGLVLAYRRGQPDRR